MDPQVGRVTLAERLFRGPLEPARALDVLEQLLEQAGAAHDAGVVHGSISPQKIILSPDGTATLTGFPSRDATAAALGRFAKDAAEPAYVAPEQIVDDPVGRRTDLYSIGVVAFAMFTGKDPFGAADGVAADNVFYRILYKPTPHIPDSALAGLPASVGPAIEKAMSKEPQSRFLDAKTFLQALRVEASTVPLPLPPDAKQQRREEERQKRDAEKLAAAASAAELRTQKDQKRSDERLEKEKRKQEEREERELAAAAPWTTAKNLKKKDEKKWIPYLLAGVIVVLLFAIGIGAAYAMGAIGGSSETTLAAIETSTSATESVTTTAGEPETTATEPETTESTEATTDTSGESTSTETVPTTTTTTVPGTSTSSTTTTTAKPTTTTTHSTTTTAKPTTTTTTLHTATITVTDSSTTYTGSAQHPSATTSPSGLTVHYSQTPTNAGTYSITITIASAGYTGSTATSFTIGKADATISVSGGTFDYDGSSHGAHLNYATGVKGESLAGSVDLGDRFTSPGEHYATWSFSNANYNSESRQVLITINEESTTTTTTAE
jgi:eukaryotic-like serine/threonine-protein kinase